MRLTDLVSRALDPEEREVVRGDLMETGEAGGRALREVLGLVVRRQSALWKRPGPWAVLIGLVLPLGLLCCLISRRSADGSAIYLWLYGNNWDSTYWSNSALRHELVRHAGDILAGYLRLFGWSLSCGLVVGLAARRSLPFQGVLFVLLVLFGEAPLIHSARDFSGNAAVFEGAFYRVLFPLVVRAGLVLAPSLWGMWWAQERGDYT
jgi:hypothetical protein